MADVKKIRFYDLTELDIYRITQSGDNLIIDFLGLDMSTLIDKFNQYDNLKTIEYYVNDILVEPTYENFTVYVSAVEKESGLVEVRGKIQTITIRKKTLEERVELLEESMGL